MPATIEEFDPSDILQPVKSPHDARQDAVEWAPNLTIAKGTVVGLITATKRVTAYATAAVDGSGTAVGIAMYSLKTDANGKVYFVTGATTAVASVRQGPHDTAPIWVSGIFDPRELTGWDADAATDLKARTTHDGFYLIPG